MMATPLAMGSSPCSSGQSAALSRRAHEAVAVGAHERHAVRRLEHGLLQMRVAGLGEARGIDHRAAAALGAELPDDLDGGLALHRDEGGVDRSVDLVHGFQRRHAAQLLALGMDGVDPARVAHGTRAPDGNVAFAAADEGDGCGMKQAGEGVMRS